MSLVFKNFKKKLSRKKYLELDFILDSKSSLVVVDENINNLNLIANVFLKKEKYEGEVVINKQNLKNLKYYPFFVDNIGFYKKITVYNNFKLLLSLYKIKLEKSVLLNYFAQADINQNEKYDKLDEDNKIKLKLLFNYLVSKDFLIFYVEKYSNSVAVMEYLETLIELSLENKKTLLLLSSSLNRLTRNIKKAVIISENKQVYFDDIDKLNVVKDLIIIEIDNYVEEILYKDLIFDFKLIDNKLIVRKSDMEDVLYYFVKSGIDVISINDFNENTKLYLDKE